MLSYFKCIQCTRSAICFMYIHAYGERASDDEGLSGGGGGGGVKTWAVLVLYTGRRMTWREYLVRFATLSFSSFFH